MCAQDMLYWVNTYAWTYDPHKENTEEHPYGPFITYEYQDPALLAIDAAIGVEDVITNKSRDMGATWCHLLVFDWRWLFREAESYLIVSRNDEYVDKSDNPKSLFWKLDCVNTRLPSWMLPPGSYKRSKANLTNLRNGCVIDGEATTGDLAAGDRRTAILLDEFAKFRVKDGVAALGATQPVSRSRFFNSTPKGTGNAHYQTWKRDGIKRLEFPWWDHPEKARGLYKTNEAGSITVLDKEHPPPTDYKWVYSKKLQSPWYDKECKRAGSRTLIAQELDMEFVGSGAGFFDKELIETLEMESAIPPLHIGVVSFDADMRGLKFNEKPEGRVQLWMDLLQDGKPPTGAKYAMGVDISHGAGASNSAIAVCDIATGEQVLEYVSADIDPTGWADIACALGWWFNEAFMVWDGQGGGGSSFRNQVSVNCYPNIYFMRDETTVEKKRSKTPGHFWKGQEKEAVFTKYANALADRTYMNRSAESLGEHQFFEHNGNTIEHSGSVLAQDPSGAKANHGDRVTAAVLCNVGMGERKEKTPEEKGVAGPGTYGHLFAQRPKKPKESQWD